jgi:hypothetical protein
LQDLFVTKMVLQTVGLSRGSVAFPNQPISTTSVAQTIVLSNSGTTTLSIANIAITGIDSADFAETSNCGSSLAPNAACGVNVIFTPATNSTRSATLEVTDNAGNSPQTTSLTGTGIVPPGAASLAPTSLTFGNQAVSTRSTPQGITLSNNGAGAVTISSIVLSGVNSGDFAETNNCPLSPSTLAGNASCVISVTFSPTATGTRTATLVVSDNATNSPQTAGLTGTGVSSTGGGSGLAVVQVQNNIDTLTIATSFSVPITTQRGDLLVAFARESSNGKDNFTVTDSAGQAWTLTSSGYKNTGSTGPRSGMFYVANSAAVTSVTVRYTTAGGVIKPGIMVMEISGAATSGVAEGSVNNGSGALVGTSTSGSLTTTNANDILIFATDTAADQKGWTPGTGYTIPNNQLRIAGSGSNIRMAMQYAVVSSNQNATSMNYSNAAWNGNIFAAFKAGSTGGSGGGSPAASLSPSSLTFVSQTVETTGAAQAVTLSNSGTATLGISSIAITGTNSGDFGQSNNCGTSVATGAQCTINVTFTPTASGTRTATLSVTDNASGSPQAVTLTGTGEAAGGSGPAFVQVQNNIDTSGAAFTSFSVPITTNPGDLLVAFVRESSNGTDKFTVTDSGGQIWTPTLSGYENESSTGPRSGMFYVANSAGVTSVTVKYTTSGGVIKPGIMVMEISGAATSDVPDGSVNNASGASVTTSTSGSLTTINANDILIFTTDAAGNQTSPGWTAGTGYVIPNNFFEYGNSGSTVRMAMQYAVVSSSQVNPKTSMTYPNAAWNGNIFAAFK